MTHEQIIKEANELIAQFEERIRLENEHIDNVFKQVHGVTYAEFQRVWDEAIINLSDDDNQHNRTV